MRAAPIGAALVILTTAVSAPVSAFAQRAPRLAIDLPAPISASSSSPSLSASDPAPDAGASSAGRVGPSVRALDVLAGGQTQDLLRNGFPARLHFRLELWRQAGIASTIQDTREWDVIVEYDPLRKQFRGERLMRDSATSLGEFDRFAQLSAAVAAPVVVPVGPPQRGRRYYFNAVLDVEMLTLSDLGEVEQWLRGLRGKRNPTGAIGNGVRRLFLRLLGAERRHYEVRSQTFKG